MDCLKPNTFRLPAVVGRLNLAIFIVSLGRRSPSLPSVSNKFRAEKRSPVAVAAGQGQPDWQADGALKPNDPAKTILQPKLTPSGRIDDFTCSLAGASVLDQVDYPLAMIDGHGFPNRPSQLREVHNGGAGAGSGDRSSMDPRSSSNSRR